MTCTFRICNGFLLGGTIIQFEFDIPLRIPEAFVRRYHGSPGDGLGLPSLQNPVGILQEALRQPPVIFGSSWSWWAGGDKPPLVPAAHASEFFQSVSSEQRREPGTYGLWQRII